jgi:hypothetical protein
MICLKHATLRELIDLKLPLETKVYWVDIYDYEKDYTKLYLEYVELASKIFGVNKSSIMTDKTHDVVEIRNMIWCVLTRIHNISTLKVGKLSNRDHSTVSYGVRTLLDRMTVDKELKRKYNVFVNSIGKNINETYDSKFK